MEAWRCSKREQRVIRSDEPVKRGAERGGLPVDPYPHHHELLTGALEEGRMSAGIGHRIGGGRK